MPPANSIDAAAATRASRWRSPEPRMASSIQTKALRCNNRVLQQAACSHDDGHQPESAPASGDPAGEAANRLPMPQAGQQQELAGGDDDDHLPGVCIDLDLEDIKLGLDGFLSPWRSGTPAAAGGAAALTTLPPPPE
ncbi:hypothetical protein E2562_012395 [Oryza meyeriana var. granulata]|uniref:Uncharacterized protein n=1 Tax=Oryza meyeriana var. granulata TaxID=110450 RepID=A0A6G1C6E3_9ORYZ|nr:hypothetical protein E2562_012395 [Oryza meyeriana var. granulata]